MPSSSSSSSSATSQYFYQFMERRRKPRGSIDELAVIKAAAWAWYQRGSGYEGKSMREYDATRTSRVQKPSRYKLEAMQKAQQGTYGIGLSRSSRSTLLSPSHTDISLLDGYEIERISRELDYYVESSNANHNGGSIDGDRGGRRSFSSSTGSEISGIKGMKKDKKKKGFWFRGYGMGACGSRDDVVENFGVHLRRRPERIA